MKGNAQIAVELAALGLPVFPCFEAGPQMKRPRCENGFHDATTDAEQIARWWRRWPHAAPGLPVPPGVVIVDSDEKTDPDAGEVYHGDDTLRRAGLIGEADRAGLIVQTPGGGLHRKRSA